MMVREFYEKLVLELEKSGVDEDDKLLIIQEAEKYLSGREEVSHNDADFIRRVIIPSVLWRGF